MMTTPDLAAYAMEAAEPHTAAYLHGPILEICYDLGVDRVLDFGCGNGALCGALASAGYEVVGCDPGLQGLAHARQVYPLIPLHQLEAGDDPAPLGEPFDLVVATEVIEHMFDPRALPRFAARVLKPGGHLIVSTPYHGYLKNLLLALTGKMDQHFTALWAHGHIKFWSRRTLTRLLEMEGFRVTGFIGAGRMHYLWKSMILTAVLKQRV